MTLALLLLGTTPAGGESLLLPVPAEMVLAPLHEACPECAETGFLPCGTADVQYGSRFAATAMQGDPAHAYLLARAPNRAELLSIVTESGADEVGATLVQALGSLRLVVLEDDWQTVRVIAAEPAPRVHVDPEQHACIRDPARGLGCCLGDGPSDRGCLPKADPPSVRLRFDDPVAGETLELRYPIGKGELRLRRRSSHGETLYWCQGWERAQLRNPSRGPGGSPPP